MGETVGLSLNRKGSILYINCSSTQFPLSRTRQGRLPGDARRYGSSINLEGLNTWQ
jgi:hypothetical protein